MNRIFLLILLIAALLSCDDAAKTETSEDTYEGTPFVCTKEDNESIAKAEAEEASLTEGWCEHCSVCVFTRQLSGETEYYLYSVTGADITVKIEFTEYENAVSDVALPYTGSVSGGDPLKVFSVRQSDAALPWNTYYYFYYTFGNIGAIHDDSYVYRLPYETGKSHTITQGYNGSFSHKDMLAYSLDMDLPVGEIVYAARDGIVAFIEDSFDGAALDVSYRKRTNSIKIVHNDGTVSEYDHIRYGGALVSQGDHVKRGDQIAQSGNVGYSSGPHLHYMVYKPLDTVSYASLPVRFAASGYTGELVEGKSYTAIE